jgi:hypothetical protein
MAIKRKPAPKPTPKPAARPTPKPLPRPKPAPLDLVRSPNFDAAMAQQRYDQMLADMTARAKAGQFDTIRNEAGQPPPQGSRVGGGNQDFIDNRDPNKNYTMNMISYIDPATGEVTSRTKGIEPAPGSRFVRYYGPSPQGQGGDMVGFAQVPQQYSGGLIQQSGGTGGYIPSPQEASGLYQDIANQQGAMASQYQNPQGQQQQMQNYQNFLQQGMQNSNTMNQGAMNNFANMQPGMQATQTASRTTPNQTMPVAGMGMQQPKQTQPRKFSTVRNTPARFG